MTTKVLVHGAKGKMGSLACQAVDSAADLSLVASTGRKHSLTDALKEYQPNVVLDFTLPECVFANTQAVLEAGAHPVVGASGLKPEQIETLSKQCEKLKRGAIIAPNFSLAAVLMVKAAAMIAPYLPDCEIIETHHPAKVDSPSGTAENTASVIAKYRRETPTLLDSSRGKVRDGVPIHSLRLPGYFATQEIVFGQAGETLSITHRAHERHALMPGVLLAIRQVTQLDSLVYGLEHIML